MKHTKHREVWIPISGFEDKYLINKRADIWSVYADKVIKSFVQSSGYASVALCVKGKKTKKLVHRLVAEAFLSNPESKPCVHHKDGNRLNNHVENLEWCTYKENNHESIKAGRWKQFGEKHPHTTISKKDVVNIRTSEMSQKKLAQKYGVSQGTISNIKRKITWKHV